MPTLRATAAILLALTLALPAAARADDDWEVKESPHGVAETVRRLQAALETGGVGVVAVVDHQANARSVQLELPEITTVIFGNPKIGTALMQENPRVALDLPLKILVWRDGDQTRIGYLEPEDLADRYDIDDDSSAIELMETALQRLTDAAIAAQ